MRRSDFHYHLPSELIAQHPLAQRTDSRLLHVDGMSKSVVDRQFVDLPALLKPHDLLVFNDTRVIPARVFGHKPSGGKVEIMLERILPEHRILAHVNASKPLRADAPVQLAGGVTATYIGRHDDLFELELNSDPLTFFQLHGALPLPPYIDRAVDNVDAERYQTVYAKQLGAVAAPTAGLHFDAAMLERLQNLGVRSGYVTLHVGAGTFQPVRVDNLDDHKMHQEIVQVPHATCDAIESTRELGGRVIAVGTTVVRSLESAAQVAGSELQAFSGETQLFIRPGYQFKIVDAMITNFHLPESTLLMLVCAFGGYDLMMAAYQHAVSGRYRFFSYGDAMFIER
jgi:S-adenosylmethionine:tRNA ribosyltransferase-isomerase